MFARSVRRILRHQISQNVVALYWMQVAAFVVPLVTLPYVSRVLGPGEFGLLVFAQGFSIVLTLLVDWGFTPYGVRAVASDRDDPDALVRTVARVRGGQLFMAAASVPVALAALAVVPKFHDHPAFLALAWIAAVATALTPNWYFIGVERVRLVTSLQLGFRAVGAALTFVFVNHPNDAWIVLALYAASSIGMWTVCDFLLFQRVRMRVRDMRPSARAVRESSRLFIGTVGGSLMSSFNVVLLGLFSSSVNVAHFGASERIVRASQQVTSPVGVAVYPRLAFLQASEKHDRARRLLAIAFLVVGGVGLLLAAVLAVFAPVWIKLIFGHKFVHQSVPLLRILVLLIPFGIIGGVAATWLMTMRRDRTLVAIALGGGLLNVVLACVLAPLFGPTGMAWSVVIAQVAATTAGMIAVYGTRDPSHSFFRLRVEPAPPAAEAVRVDPGR
jgi:PST family polysaccharide transporter